MDNSAQQRTVSKEVLLKAWGENDFALNTDFKGQEVQFNIKKYIPNAAQVFEADEAAQETYLHFVESSSGSRHDHYIKKGTIENVHGILVGFDANNQAGIEFKDTADGLLMQSAFEGTYLRMADQFKGAVAKDTLTTFNYLSLHQLAGLSFVVPSPPEKGSLVWKKGDKEEHPLDLLEFEVTSNQDKYNLSLQGAQYNTSAPKQFQLAGLNFRVTYGAKEMQLPFAIQLNDFQLQKYPGSESAQSYASEITVLDTKEKFDYRIYYEPHIRP